MKGIIVALLLILPSITLLAQKVSVENNLWGVQLGIYPASFHNETKITNAVALRSELGFSYGWTGHNGINGPSEWAIIPNIDLEPRFYYNLSRRSKLNKRTDNNSGNYFSLNFGHSLGGLAVTSENIEVYPSIHLIPMYGLRRNMGKNFNFEFAFGMGYGWIFKEYQYWNFTAQRTDTFKDTDHGFAIGIRLAVGCTF